MSSADISADEVTMTDLAALSPNAFRDFLLHEGIRRFFLVWDDERGEVRASHPLLEPLARLVGEDRRDFDRHEGFFVQVAPDTGVLQGACVHRTCRGQAAGGVRFWRYDTVEEYLRDGLRLARGMTHKNALAGLWWGGGKGVMARGTGPDEADPAVRRRIYEEYGELMTSLRGCYVTAEDVGTSVEDMAAIFSRTRFTTCIPPEARRQRQPFGAHRPRRGPRDGGRAPLPRDGRPGGQDGRGPGARPRGGASRRAPARAGSAAGHRLRHRARPGGGASMPSTRTST